ncbi:MAG TPA: hypothetical protein VEU77_11905 [Candidatus Acidoferrales bacterium]|nr:hypothetical protein [Candidatus Acidoferrales bacterium]
MSTIGLVLRAPSGAVLLLAGCAAITWTFVSLIWLLTSDQRIGYQSLGDVLVVITTLPGVIGIASAEFFTRAGLPGELGFVVAFLAAFVVIFAVALSLARLAHG